MPEEEVFVFPIEADLPENWVGANAITPSGTEAGLTPQHGYNYLMRKVNAALKAANFLNDAIEAKEPGTGGNVSFKDIQGAVADNTALKNALDAKLSTSEKNKPGGYLGIGQDGFADATFLPPVVIPEPAKKKMLRQLDLMVPGKFASETGNTKLAVAGDFSYWLLESGIVRSVSARCSVADSGATPAKVRLVINDVPCGPEISVVASSHTIASITDDSVKINNKDRIEIAVTATGTNKDSSNLRVFVVAEVEL